MLEDPTVSHQRLIATAHADGRVVVTDLGSHNGTWIDGEAVCGPDTVVGSPDRPITTVIGPLDRRRPNVA